MNLATKKRGSQLPQSKLTEDAVRQARREYLEGRQQIQALQRKYSVAGIAERFGVSTSAMEKALAGSTWGHVK